MEDIQSSTDQRGIAIQKVGINEVHLPLLIKMKDGGFQQVLACIRFTVSLPEHYKGTHMSRFLEILYPWSRKPVAEHEMEVILEEAMSHLAAPSADLAIRFKYFIDREAPVTRQYSCLDLDCCFSGTKKRGDPMVFTLRVEVPVTSLCPCSKAISAYGAHNQRGTVRVKLLYSDFFWIEDIILGIEACASGALYSAALLEAQGSCPVYPLLKREDEKYVTERAYENPKFVEDILRDSVLALRRLPGLQWFALECENFESIHNHNAFASHEEFVEL